MSNTGHINRTREEPSEQHRPHQQNKGGLATQTTSTEQGRNPDDDEISNTDHINRKTGEEPSEQHRPHQQNKGGTQMPAKGKQFLFHIRNPPCYS